jgi:hypothetical protein
MKTVALVIILAGFLVSLLSLGLASSTGARLVMVLAGIAVSLTGLIGVLNPVFIKEAIWKK